MTLFKSFFMGGFECSTHRRCDGKRVDVIASTGHDRHALSDYRQLAAHGMTAARDGMRWHMIEPHGNGRYDWSTFLPQLRAAHDTGTQVIWDLMHYGWPDAIDIWSPAFVDAFASFAHATAQIIARESDEVPWFCPVNEISCFAWRGGDVSYFNPFARGRGVELKRQLIRASIAAVEAIRSVDGRARFVHAEPAINVVPDPDKGRSHRDAAICYNLAQFQAWDGLAGYIWPELGGQPDYLDVLGLNYYSDSQWIFRGLRDGPQLERGHKLYCPFNRILTNTYNRYKRPLFVSETGIENEPRAEWLRYICDETRAAMTDGVPVAGICLYPVVNHPGWLDDRDCHNGLFEAEPKISGRTVYQPLADELAIQMAKGFDYAMIETELSQFGLAEADNSEFLLNVRRMA